MRQPRILMCPPDYFGIEYEINPWMSRARGAAPERARMLHIYAAWAVATMFGGSIIASSLEKLFGLFT